jgi:hypothetical protein
VISRTSIAVCRHGGHRVFVAGKRAILDRHVLIGHVRRLKQASAHPSSILSEQTVGECNVGSLAEKRNGIAGDLAGINRLTRAAKRNALKGRVGNVGSQEITGGLRAVSSWSENLVVSARKDAVVGIAPVGSALVHPIGIP